jgi:tryptophan-rich sensory protein
MTSNRLRAWKLLTAIAIAQMAGIIGSLATAGSVDTWYTTLVRPIYTPPGWLFGPVWIILYTLIGISIYLVWTKHTGGRKRTLWLRLMALHLVLNTLWSIIFFGQQLLLGAFIEILVLIATLVWLIGLAWRFNRQVAYLLLPYLAWVSFAALLNYMLWQLNP